MKWTQSGNLALIAATAITSTLLVGCERKSDAAEIVATAYAEICPPSSSDCYALLIPKADVLAQGDGDARGIALSGVTDSHGVKRFPITKSGTYNIRITSFVLQDGSAEKTITVGRTGTVDVELKGKAASAGCDNTPPR